LPASTYLIYGLGIAVDSPLPRLSGAPPASRIDVVLTLGSMPPWRDALIASSAELWQVRRREGTDEPPWLTVWKLGKEAIRLLYYDGVDVLLARDGTRVWVTWPDRLTLDDVSAYLLGPVLGVLLRLRGVTSLHASAVALADRAAVFVGRQGAGKSTTAAALLARGHRVLADDVVPLMRRNDTWMAQPGYPCLRLWHDAIGTLAASHQWFAGLPDAPASDAYHVNLADCRDSFHPAPLPVAAIYFFDERSHDPRAPFISPVPAADGLMHLVAHTFANTYLDAAGRAGEFDALGDVAASVPIRRIHAHADPAHLGRLCDMIVDGVLDDSLRTVR
jgi:hypothetical protein